MTSAPSADQTPEIADVLTWMPPTPQLLTDATLLLLRITIHGSDNVANIIHANDARWNSLRNAWFTLLKEYKENETQELSPMTLLAASLACHDDDSLFPEQQRTKAMEGAALFGILLGLGENEGMPLLNDDDDNNNEGDLNYDAITQGQRDSWKKVVLYLLNEEDTSEDRNDNLPGGVVDCWDVDARPLLEVAVCYAARRSKDLQALASARAICSKGLALRSTSPEEWYRYSTILSELGDDQAAERAFGASISLGAGEGGSGVH